MASESSGIWKDCSGHVHGRLHPWVRRPFTILPLLLNVGSRLGDRHCENILLDSNTGDTVHVDFNCLFERVCFS